MRLSGFFPALALFSAGAACALATATAFAQDHESMRKAMQAAQASASKPGDENLDCEQLQKEFAATTTDPALHAQVGQAGAQAQEDLEAMKQARAGVAAQTATTAAGALVPGADMAAMAAAVAQAESSKAAGARRMPSRMAQAGQWAELMPNLMRGERLVQLAVAKNCAWAADFGAVPAR